MDQDQKSRFQAELMGIKGSLSAVNAFTAPLNQTAFPVAGPMVMIPSLPAAAQAIKQQNDAVIKLTEMVGKILDAM